MSSQNIAQVSQICSSIAESAADQDGFVPIRSLLSGFQAELIVRPLLVEGMIAQINTVDEAHGAGRWAVLVDSESIDVGDIKSAIDCESQTCPLPIRLRYTIAHELVHSIAFRPQHFGMRLMVAGSVKDIEAETDRITPSLLLPTKSLHSWLRTIRRPVAAEDLARLRVKMGVSRQTLVSRLATLKSPDLHNLAVGVGQWGSKGDMLFRKWPLFASFDRALLPTPLIRLQVGQDRASGEDIFGSGAAQHLGDSSNEAEFLTKAGTRSVPEAADIRVCVKFESVPRRFGTEFLFTIHGKLLSREPPSVVKIIEGKEKDQSDIRKIGRDTLDEIRKRLSKRN